MDQPSDGPEAALLALLDISRSGANLVGNLVLRTANWVQANFGAPPAPAPTIEDGWEVVVDDGTLTASDDTSDLEDRYDDNGGLFDGEPITGRYTLAECLGGYGGSDDESDVDSSHSGAGKYSTRWEPEVYDRSSRIILIDRIGIGDSRPDGGPDDEVKYGRDSRCSGHPKLGHEGDQHQVDANPDGEDGNESDSEIDVYVDARSHVESELPAQDESLVAVIISEPRSPEQPGSHPEPVAGSNVYRKLEAMLRARVVALWEKAAVAADPGAEPSQ
ncbi:hypothetical protein VTH06DRAFT_3115 [Thermothelomyces fergusii]